MIKKILLLIFILIIIGSALDAGMLDSELGVRTKGLGDAFTGIADDINAIYFNPAGLGQMQKGEIFLMHDNQFNLDLINNTVLSIATPDIATGTFGFSYKRLGVSDNVSFLQNYSENLYTISYGVEVLPLFYAGLNVKYLQVSYTTGASALSSDFGLLLRTFEKHLNIGVFIKNINTPTIHWDDTTVEDIDKVIRIGLGFRPNDDLVIGFDVDDINEQQLNFHGGIELWLFDRFIAPRVGIAYLQNDGSTLNFGFSIRYKNLRFDYAFEDHYELGINNSFGILIKF